MVLRVQPLRDADMNGAKANDTSMPEDGSPASVRGMGRRRPRGSVERDASRLSLVSCESEASAGSSVSLGSDRSTRLSTEARVLKVVAASLQAIAKRGAAKAGKGGSGKSFEGSSAPSVGIADYLKRMMRYLESWKPCQEHEELPIGMRTLVMALLFIDRLCEANADFVITPANVHRVCLVAFLVSVKSYEDVPFPNSFWARVGGVHVSELNRLEVAFLGYIKFDALVLPHQFEALLQRVLQGALC